MKSVGVSHYALGKHYGERWFVVNVMKSVGKHYGERWFVVNVMESVGKHYEKLSEVNNQGPLFMNYNEGN